MFGQLLLTVIVLTHFSLGLNEVTRLWITNFYQCFALKDPFQRQTCLCFASFSNCNKRAGLGRKNRIGFGLFKITLILGVRVSGLRLNSQSLSSLRSIIIFKCHTFCFAFHQYNCIDVRGRACLFADGLKSATRSGVNIQII